MAKETLHSSLVRRIRADDPPPDLFDANAESLPQHEKDFHFAMQCNGYFLHTDGKWSQYISSVPEFLADEFKSQRISFFGPDSSTYDGGFFSGKGTDLDLFTSVFKQREVTDAIRKYREIDEDLAARIAFTLGGITRYFGHSISFSTTAKEAEDIANKVKFAAKMTMLGDRRSGGAIASAIAMYIISGGPTEDNRQFAGDTYRMAEAVSKDPVIPDKTEDLGLSQAARLLSFQEQKSESKIFPNVAEHMETFEEFPTVGAEFHFPLDIVHKYPNFWQRLTILNMSQYQKGSCIQFSRNDRNVIEIRMNPSVFPVTIANWNRMRVLLPELNNAFFTITLNRKDKEGNFEWKDLALLRKLQTLGMLTYAALFEDVSTTGELEEVNFGTIYLGETVKVKNGVYVLSGLWSRPGGLHGQLGIYAGFGPNLPHLAYYLSMALADPRVLDSVPDNVRTLQDALAVSSKKRQNIFKEINERIQKDEKLKRADMVGRQMVGLLNP